MRRPAAAASATIAPPPLWLLVIITGSGTLGMHIFVPALPIAAQELGVSTGAMQLTISLYLVGLAFGQLLYGPISDRFGRRRVLFAGLLLYAAGGLAAALAPGIRLLIGARLVQAMGGCSGLVLGRAIVRDTAEPQEAAGRLALLNLVLSLSPGLAPLVGGWLAVLLGWRSIFLALCLIACLTLAAAVLRLPETRRAGPADSFKALMRGYGQLVLSRSFIGYTVAGACTTTSMYAFTSASPFIFVNQLHRPVHEVGVYYLILLLGVTLGSVLANRLVVRVGMGRLLRLANAAGTVGALIYLAAVLTGHLSVLSAVAPVFLFTVGVGTAAPLALTKAVSVNPALTGSAAGLYGFGQMALGALCTALAGIGSDPALASAIVLATAGLLGQVAAVDALRRDGGR